MTTKQEYAAYQVKFIELRQANPKLTIQDFCDSMGLNYSSAKRYIKQNYAKTNRVIPKKPDGKISTRTDDEWRELYMIFLQKCEKDPTLTIPIFAKKINENRRTVLRKFSLLRKEPEFNALILKADQKRKEHEESLKKPPRKGVAKHAIKLVEEGTPTYEAVAAEHKHRQAAGRDQNGRFIRGNKCGVIHGGYAAACGLDDDLVQIAAEIDPSSVANELIAARSQYISMQRYVNTTKRGIEERYANGNPQLDENGDPIPMESAIMRLLFGTSEKMRQLEMSIQGLVGTYAKVTKDLTMTDIKLRESREETANEILATQSQLLRDRQKYDWTAAETVRQFELRAIPAPEFLVYEAKVELENYVPPVEEGGVSDEELDLITEQYIESQAQEGDWIQQRQEEVRRVFAQMDAHDQGLTPDDFDQAGQPDSQDLPPASQDLPPDSQDLPPATSNGLDDIEAAMADAFRTLATHELMDGESE